MYIRINLTDLAKELLYLSCIYLKERSTYIQFDKPQNLIAFISILNVKHFQSMKQHCSVTLKHAFTILHRGQRLALFRRVKKQRKGLLMPYSQ
jgi:hypothetical protein